mmetsp:Transcript_70756/g.118313  ORF Transcript_70756/g.118313 Transcript_70756/m.118313 type:complete len:249 (-) Transcript_70756:201-947(-)
MLKYAWSGSDCSSSFRVLLADVILAPPMDPLRSITNTNSVRTSCSLKCGTSVSIATRDSPSSGASSTQTRGSCGAAIVTLNTKSRSSSAASSVTRAAPPVMSLRMRWVSLKTVQIGDGISTSTWTSTRAAAVVTVADSDGTAVAPAGVYRGATEVGSRNRMAPSLSTLRCVTYLMVISTSVCGGRLPSRISNTSGLSCSIRYAPSPLATACVYLRRASSFSMTSPTTTSPLICASNANTAACSSRGKT